MLTVYEQPPATELVADDAEALIKEARRRARRRRGRIAVLVLLAGVVIAYVASGVGGSARPHPGRNGRPASAAVQQPARLAAAVSLVFHGGWAPSADVSPDGAG